MATADRRVAWAVRLAGVALLLCLLLSLAPGSMAAGKNSHRKHPHAHCHKVHGKKAQRCKKQRQKGAKKKRGSGQPAPPNSGSTSNPIPPAEEASANPESPSDPGLTPPGPGGPELEPAPPVDQVAADLIEKLPGPGDSTLILSGSHTYLPGEYLTTPPSGEAPEGFLLKVVRSAIAGGATEVETEPGSLFEAVPNGEIDADLSGSTSTTPMNSDARRLRKANAAAAAAGPREADVPFGENVHCESGAEMHLTGSLHASLVPHVDLEWHKFHGIPVSVDTAKATLDASVEAEAEAAVSASASCTLDPVTLLEPEWLAIVDVAGILVPVRVKVPVILRGSASVSGGVSVTATVGAHGSLGVAYEEGQLKGIHDLTDDATLEHHADLDADADAGVGPDVTIIAGWQIPGLGSLDATFEIGVAAGPRLHYASDASPPGSLCAHLNLHGSVTVDIPHAEITSGVKDLFDEDTKCVTWGAEITITNCSAFETGAAECEEDTIDAGIHQVWTVGEDGEYLENVSADANLVPGGPGLCTEYPDVGTRLGWVCHWSEPGTFTLTAIYEGEELVLPVIVSFASGAE
jgi:hypothetical protein